ncbi:MAG: glycogen debranching protein [Myxococcales bacterium]|nr:MAG: glycogen debranching protein [Myxococcales bacterium]
MSVDPNVSDAEWLEPDGLGGFASGTVSGVRTRRYHALLLCSLKPPQDRRALVQGFVAWLETPNGRAELWPQSYAGGYVRDRDGELSSFSRDPWPVWRIQTTLGPVIEVELFVPHGRPAVALRLRLAAPWEGPVTLHVRPLLSGRDFHALHHENPAFHFPFQRQSELLRFTPYPGAPAVQMLSNARFEPAPDWYRHFHYREEEERGLDATEDLASPGVFTLSLEHERREMWWLLQGEVPGALAVPIEGAATFVQLLRRGEHERRAQVTDPLDRAAEAYVVKRGEGKTVLAGYPWFGDWGRDTFIALRGLCLARDDDETARSILLEWAAAVSEGMLPNRFSDRADQPPEYNAVDAALWFVQTAHELIAQTSLSLRDRQRLEQAMVEIVSGYARGTRYGIGADTDGLLWAGAPGVQLTWMDAKVGDWVVTPRRGKPVEVQALWLTALSYAARVDGRFTDLRDRASESFRRRFWNRERGMLFDVVDVDRVPGKVDASCRPNQVLAVGGLPLTFFSPEQCAKVVSMVERELYTPLGLRSLGPQEPEYRAHYTGGVMERDGAYHQGTVWPWLLGPFVEAWVKAHGNSGEAKARARERFLPPLREHLGRAGLGHVSEIADAEWPHTPRGCPFQAWSLSELIRLERRVLAP